jgi:hypothetical protein
MANINPNENSAIKAMMRNLEITMKMFASNPALDFAVKQENMVGCISGLQAASKITQQFNNIFSGNELITKSFLSTFAFQTELLRNTQNYYLTETLNSFRNNLFHNDYFAAIEAITKSLKLPIIEAPNIALLKLNKSLMGFTEFELPRGMRSTIESLHISTAQELSKSDSVSFDCSQATFFIDAEPENSCTAKEANVIYSATRLFDELTDEDLFSFLRYLSSFYSLGLSHHVGEKILKIVKDIESVVSFDSELYYHARSLDDGVCPFTDEDMICAPHGITFYGRFNHIGENYFYFSNQKAGAIEEVRKHSPKNRVQVAKLKTKDKVKMVDISHDKENTFLKYCRFPFDPKSDKKVPREYLIPSFFSDCCKLTGFDGIKYYGTKDYYNYVTWSDGHFIFVSQEIL